MNRIKVISIEKGAEYEGIIYDCWFNVELENNKKIILFNDKYLDDLESFLHTYLQVELSSIFITKELDNELFSFQGEIILLKDEYYFIGDNIKIKIPKTENIELGKKNMYYFGRIDIDKIIDVNDTVVGANPIQN